MRKKRFNKFNIFLLIALFTGLAFAAGVPERFPTDIIQFGKNSSTDDKQIIIDTGDGVNNPTITVDDANTDFTFNQDVNVTGNNFNLGDGTNTNKVWEWDIGAGAANPKYRYSQADASLQFANDGVNFRNIGAGSGGGGGINFLQDFNSDIEAGSPPNNWSVTGGVFTSETTEPLFGKQSGSWDASALGQTLRSNIVALSPGFAGAVGQTCQATVYYKYTGSDGDLSLQVLDQTTTVIAEIPLPATTGDEVKQGEIFWDCQTLADSAQFGFEAEVADPALLIYDNVFLGTGKQTLSISQTEVIGEMFADGSCLWSSTAASYSDFTPDGACILTSNGKATTTAGLPQINFAFLPPGKYEVSFTSFFNFNVANATTCRYRLVDESNTTGDLPGNQITTVGSTQGPGESSDSNVLNEFFTYTTPQTNKSFKVQVLRSGGTSNCQMGSSHGLKMWVKRHPINSTEAISLRTSGFWANVQYDATNATIAGSGVPTGGFVRISNSSLFIDLKEGHTESLMIPCVAPEAPSGDTCTGDETVGISWVADTAGAYKVCFQGTHQFNTVNAALGSNLLYSLTQVETTPVSEAVVRQAHYANNITEPASNANTAWSESWSNCHIWEFASAGRKVIRLYNNYELDTNTTVTHNWQQTAGTGSAWSVSVEKITEQKPTPVFTDLRNDLIERPFSFEGNQKILQVETSLGGAHSIIRQTGNWVQSLTDNGIGDQTITFQPSVFNNTPYCQAISGAVSTTQGVHVSIVSINSSSIRIIVTEEGGTEFDSSAVFVQCVGN